MQVAEFLGDEGVSGWVVDSLADLLRSELEPRWTDAGHENRINADMQSSVMPVCEV